MSSHTTENKTLKSDLNVKIALPRLAGMAMERHFQKQSFVYFPGDSCLVGMGATKGTTWRKKHFSMLTDVHLKI